MAGEAVVAASERAVTRGAADEQGETGEAASSRPPRSRRRTLLLVGLVALVVSPVVVGGLSFIGDTWHPAGDWAHFVYRVSQVGTRETPLVGTYTVKGWAHPGPLGFWLAAPLYRLVGEDPRALQWTAAAVNVAVLAALAAVAWRRGRWPLFLATMAVTAVLVRGISPEHLVDLWNPFLPLTSFLLVLYLAWDAALGRRRALLEAVLPATLAMQCHLAFVTLIGLVAVWLVAWSLLWPRVLGTGGGRAGDDTTGDDTDTDDTTADDTDTDDPALAELPRPPWGPWFRVVRLVLAGAAVLWLAPLADALFDLHNPWNIAKSFGSDTVRAGPVRAVGLVGRYVRPDGPWMGGPEPTGAEFFTIQGSGPLPVLLALAVLAGCLHLGRRRRWPDVTALATLSLTLVVGAVPAVSQIPMPVEEYLTQWLKVLGALVWFTVIWTGWRLVEARVRAVERRRVAAAALAVGVVVVATASTWGEASTLDLPLDDRGRHVEALADDLEGELPRDQTIRVVRRGEFFHVYAAGVFYELVQRGFDVVTDEGAAGLKWGHAHRWSPGEPYDLLLTVAVNDAVVQCDRRSDARLLAAYDGLSPQDRRWLTDVQLRRLEDPDLISPEEQRRADALGEDDVRVSVFEGPRPCASDRN